MAPQQGEADVAAGPWPAVGWEEAGWAPDPAVAHSHRERRAQTGPYRRAVPPFIASAQIAISSALAAQIEDASSEIVRFDAEMGAEIAPYGAVLLRSESTASSRIEHLTASARAIATTEVGEGQRGSNAAEIVANTRSMQRAIELADDLDARTILALHEILMQDDPHVTAGQWRTQQVWIGPGSAGPRLADYVAPDSDRIDGLITDLTTFMKRNDLPVVALAAVAHAQFETIHPFPDGNGRTGRALVHAILRNRAMTRSTTVPISAGLLRDTRAYFEALTRYRTGDTDDIVAMMCSASLDAVVSARTLVSDLRTIRQEWEERLKVRRGSDALRLADLLIRQPVITTEVVTRELGITPNNVARVVGPFVSAGILIASRSGSRGRAIWRSPEVLSELDSFADRAGRRGDAAAQT
jgi:Fic family protein